MLIRIGKICSHRAEAGAQPTHLPAVANLVLGDMEPRPVCIHCGGDAERLLQPCIVARGKALEARHQGRLASLFQKVTRPLPVGGFW